MKSPRNTAEFHPSILLLDAMVRGPSASIEAMERVGQAELVSSDVLPREINDLRGREILESFGVQFLGDVPDDELFQYVKLPEGWKKAARGDHDMWSHLLDEQGRERASIFYKAAFYDRRALLHLARRFNVERDWERKDVIAYRALDGKIVVFEPPPRAITGEPYSEQSRRDGEDLKALCERWLDEHHEGWKSPAACWGEPPSGAAP